jgi:hypothetical protein
VRHNYNAAMNSLYTFNVYCWHNHIFFFKDQTWILQISSQAQFTIMPWFGIWERSRIPSKSNNKDNSL